MTEENIVIQELLNSDFATLSSDDSSSFSSGFDTTDSEVEQGAPRRNKIKIQNYVENVVSAYSDEEFKKHFRMKRTTCYILIERLRQSAILPSHEDEREKLSAEKTFLMTLWYLGNIETFRQVGDRFNCTDSSVYRTIRRVVMFLLSIKGEIIKWPSAEQAIQISEGFKNIRGIENVIGLIDGSHIEIPKPKENQDAYCNRKGYHSLLLQGIVDNNKKFIDVFCGEPGSMNDARLLRKSGIFKKMDEEPGFMGEYFLLGDSAYPNMHWLVSPFIDNGNLSRHQRQFNYYHSATRIIVENAFGLLKGRFRRLRKLDNKNMKFCSELIMASCILHNICIDYSDFLNHDGEDDVDHNQPIATFSPVTIAGGNTRQLTVFRNLFPLN